VSPKQQAAGSPEWLSLLIWSRNTEAYPEKDANEGTASSKILVTFVLCANFYSPSLPPSPFPSELLSGQLAHEFQGTVGVLSMLG